jgi:NADH:ubiquinone oxidoreductase subunit 6 (subunit J)
MENVKQTSTKVAFKWAIIYFITSIVFTYVFQFLNVDQSSSIKYLGYIPFIAFLFLAQKEYRDQLDGFLTFSQGFMAGFIYSVFGGIMIAIFTYIYLTFLSPQIWEQMMAASRDQMVAKNLPADQIDTGMEITRKYGTIFALVGVAIVTPIIGAIIALIGAAIFKKERSITDIENNLHTDPTV